MVWDLASNARRIISIQNTHYWRVRSSSGNYGRFNPKFSHRRQPPLLSVCRASRTIAMKKLRRIPWTTAEKPSYYNKNLDIVMLPHWDRFPGVYANWEIKNLGLHFCQLNNIVDGRFVHLIKGVKQVFLATGEEECHPNSEVFLAPVDTLYDVKGNGEIKYNRQYSRLQNEAMELGTHLKNAAEQHNQHQKQRKEEGKEREPDWHYYYWVKTVKIMAVSRVASPYSC